MIQLIDVFRMEWVKNQPRPLIILPVMLLRLGTDLKEAKHVVVEELAHLQRAAGPAEHLRHILPAVDAGHVGGADAVHCGGGRSDSVVGGGRRQDNCPTV